MTAVNFERQLPSKFTFFAVFFNYRGKHLLRVRNINAPLPGTYDPENPNNALGHSATLATLLLRVERNLQRLSLLWWAATTDEQRLFALRKLRHRQRQDGH